MKKYMLILLVLFMTPMVMAFEGVVHCVKTENGQTTEFDFYVKEGRICAVSTGADGNYKIIFNQGSSEMLLCIDNPQFEEKGYYRYTPMDERSDRLEVLKEFKTDAIEIGGELCEGYTMVTNEGSAVAYFGTEEISLKGFSMYLNDPVYTLLDATENAHLPRKLVVNTNGSSYTIDLSVEATSVSDALFDIPDGYVEFNVDLKN